MESPGQFTCCYGCKYGYEAGCVLRLALIMDGIFFGLWLFHGISLLGAVYLGAIVYLYLICCLGFAGYGGYCIFLAIKIREMAAQGILAEKIQQLLKIRQIVIMVFVATGVIIAIIFYIVIKSYYKDLPGMDSVASSTATSVSLSIVLPFIVDAIILYGYKQSFTDATQIITGKSITNGAVHPATPGM